MMSYHLYIIQSQKDGSYYIGSTKDMAERLERHSQGRSQHTKSKRPWIAVYSEEHSDRSTAVKRESEIKKRKSKNYIESLIAASSPA